MSETLATNAPKYMVNPRGDRIDERLVAPADKLKDQTVRMIMGHAEALAAQVSRFKGHTFDDIAALFEALSEQYGEQLGGPKGNMQILSYDGLMKIEVQNAQHIAFGPELQIAKNLVDQCIESWAEGVNPQIRALVDHAFQVDTQGKISTSRLLALRRLEIEDASWKSAMRALTDSIQTIGSKQYIRFYKRDTPMGEWRSIRIDLAAVERPLAGGQ
ncbi:DUF3164 family protein [Ferrovibrio sp.]|uniref:DUF3164 family protein n=1 Tax=Ferrovibrio sp. TaxID=1917215 RepID=UPI0035B45F53